MNENGWLSPVQGVWENFLGAAGNVFAQQQRAAENKQIRERSFVERVGITNMLLIAAGLVGVGILWRKFGR